MSVSLIIGNISQCLHISNHQIIYLKYIYLIIFFSFFWLNWVLVAVHRLSLVVASGGYSAFGSWTSHGGGFSCCRAQALGTPASVAAPRGLSSCGQQAQLLCSMWNLPRSGIEPATSSALACGFSSTVPPRKSKYIYFFNCQLYPIKLKRKKCILNGQMNGLYLSIPHLVLISNHVASWPW